MTAMKSMEVKRMVTFFQSRTGLALLGFLAIASFYLITEHTAHVMGFLPYGLLLLCPLLHVFMHGGHGGHGGHAQHDANVAQSNYVEQADRSSNFGPSSHTSGDATGEGTHGRGDGNLRDVEHGGKY
jgi:hypothetical protein